MGFFGSSPLATALVGLTLFLRVYSLSLIPQTKGRGSKCRSTAENVSSEPPTLSKRAGLAARTVQGPSGDTKPDYESIHGPLGKRADTVFMTVFRSQLAEKAGVDSKLPKDDYHGIIELSAAMNSRYSDRRQVQQVAQNVLISLFPSWMPSQYAALFSKPFPKFSARMNAWATQLAGTWLMGECEVNDVEVDGGTIGKDQGLLVKRCRFLEESGCASVCVNSCKIPTQTFFMENMGLPLTMTPDYDTFECQFAFGKTPSMEEELEAKLTPCLSRCPTSGKMRSWHDGSSAAEDAKVTVGQCTLMDNEDTIR